MERHEGLEGIGVLADLPPEVRRSCAARCSWREFKPHQEIVGHQDASCNVFFLTRGKASPTVYSAGGKQVKFPDINEGDMFGAWAAIDSEPRSASVEAVTHCTVASMSQDAFWEVIRSDRMVIENVLKLLVSQVRYLSNKVVVIITQSVRKRIAYELLLMAERIATDEGKAVIYPQPTGADLAARVGTARETVVRELGDMEKEGLIERKDGRVLVVPDIERLRRVVAEPSDE
jgi:CRP/FNR family cyclic AMP-dependent transcriptional regulator